MKKYNLSKIMKRAWELVKKTGMTISTGLKKAWAEAKNTSKETVNVVVSRFDSYNVRRYSTPWICLMSETGKHDFSKEVGTFTGDRGREGDLVVFRPVVGQVYGWGQKDYRGNKTVKNFAKWDGSRFVDCDKLGNVF